MSIKQLDDLCGNSEFWNVSVVWNTDDPDFTSCFQKTFLIWLPCAFLWLFTPLEIFYFKNSINRNVPYGFVNISKLVLTVALITLSAIDLIVAIVNNDDVFDVDYIAPAIKIATFALSAVLLEANRRYGLRTSGLQFLFWLLLLVCGTPQLRTQIIKHDGDDNSLKQYFFVSYLIFFILNAAVWFLNCFADREPLETKYSKSDKPYPELGASFLSRLFFTWFDYLTWKGYRKPLEQNDLSDINPAGQAKEIIEIFMKYWHRAAAKAAKYNASIITKKKQRQASIVPAIWKSFGPTFSFGAIFHLFEVLLSLVSPQIFQKLIVFVQEYNESEEYLWHGIFYAVLLFIVASVQTLLAAQYFIRMNFVGLHIRTALVGAIYKKSLTLSNTSRKSKTAGEIVNLMAVDAQRFLDLSPYLNQLWSAPLQIGLALYLLWQLLGPSVLAGLAVMIILIPVNGYVGKLSTTLQVSQMKNKDERVKLMNEILGGIKVLKLYAWENSFEKRVEGFRDREIKVLKKAAYLNAASSFIWTCAPFMVSLFTFCTYVYTGDDHVLTADKAFTAITLFNTIAWPLAVLPLLVVFLVETIVAVRRINAFMNSDELDARNVSHDPSEETPIIVENGTFSWGNVEKDDKEVETKTYPETLRNINMQVKKNTLVAVVGTVGAGKSSVISALLGEMEKLSGRVNTYGSIAYVSQQAWIQNATLRDNILFGLPMDRKRYNQVIETCALKADIDMLPGGDGTEIGEKGINLSGGQKQRVSLARAVYNQADIYLLDDPLSAVDSHVGKHIFENVIGPTGILATKTRILVTHGIVYLPNVDNIYVVKDGEISESGTMQELINKKGDFAEFLDQHLQDVNEDEENLEDVKLQLESQLGTQADSEIVGKLARAISRDRSHSVSDSETISTHLPTESIGNGIRKRTHSRQDTINSKADEPEQNGQTLIEEEKLEIGGVKWGVYKHYFMYIGFLLIGLTFVSNILYQVVQVGSNLWLADWANSEDKSVDAAGMRLGVYGALGFAQVFFTFLSSILSSLGFIYSARSMHNVLLANVMRWPMSSFDTMPLGRILNRFSKDVDAVDNALPAILRFWLSMLFTVLSTIVVISASTPLFIAVILPIVTPHILYYFVQRFYITTSRQLKRLESVSKSPIYSQFSESIQGAPTIRAYNVQQRFITESEKKVDYNQVSYVPSIVANRWLAVRLEMTGNLIILFAALFAVLNHELAPGTVALSISYALQITQSLNFLVQMTSEVETNIVAVERIKEYSETKQEAPWNLPNENVPKSWPENGQVQFKDFDVRYREGLDLVLHKLSLTVNGTEKVGIVGRTGAGKSSLTLALFRIIESAGGSIIIDGQDISKLGLHTLRSRLTIIPQDPVLFSGTLRNNLDPFEEKSDDELWRALELAHLKSFVKGLTSGLNHEVSECGENLSVGQRQLVCLARALLRKTKVLILDEATASVDLETDDLIQKTIRSEFKDCTILIIAHRLNTIIDADKIVVLDHGRLSEFDTPQHLLSNKNSAFYSMAKDAGLV